jgi:hypothetical protein
VAMPAGVVALRWSVVVGTTFALAHHSKMLPALRRAEVEPALLARERFRSHLTPVAHGQRKPSR